MVAEVDESVVAALEHCCVGEVEDAYNYIVGLPVFRRFTGRSRAVPPDRARQDQQRGYEETDKAVHSADSLKALGGRYLEQYPTNRTKSSLISVLNETTTTGPIRDRRCQKMKDLAGWKPARSKPRGLAGERWGRGLGFRAAPEFETMASLSC